MIYWGTRHEPYCNKIRIQIYKKYKANFDAEWVNCSIEV